jgi:hypothetical protein
VDPGFPQENATTKRGWPATHRHVKSAIRSSGDIARSAARGSLAAEVAGAAAGGAGGGCGIGSAAGNV